jgi:hypothetical protein
LEFPARIQSGRGCPGALGLRWPVRGSL